VDSCVNKTVLFCFGDFGPTLVGHHLFLFAVELLLSSDETCENNGYENFEVKWQLYNVY